MPTLTIEYTTEAERLQYERVIAYVQEMARVGATAAHGTVMDRCELFALDAGRKLLRDHLAAAVQARADAEKKSPGSRSKGRQSRQVITALGPVQVSREYSWHRDDGGVFRADLALGLDGGLREASGCAGAGEPKLAERTDRNRRALAGRSSGVRELLQARVSTGFEPETARVWAWCSTVELLLHRRDRFEPGCGTRRSDVFQTARRAARRSRCDARE